MRLLEIVKLLLPVRMSMPDTETPPLPKKSKMLLPSMTLPVLTVLLLVVVPTAEIALTGRFAPAGPMLFFEIRLLLLPTMLVPDAGDVLKRIAPPAVPTATVDDPWMLEFFTMLFDAPLMKRIVLVPAVVPVFAFDRVSELPPVIKPSIVTLSAPFKSTSGVARFPEIVRAAPPLGAMVIPV